MRNIYERADKAIQDMNRENLKAFDALKLSRMDGLHIIQMVMQVYKKSEELARLKYYEIAFEVYVLTLIETGMKAKEAHAKAEEVIDYDWVDEMLEETDFITLYRFTSETARKRDRLIEALAAANGENRDAEIDKALRYWTRQVGQYCLNAADYARIEAFEDAGIEWVQWITQHDERVCDECYPRDGQVYRIGEVPTKHYSCRCYLVAAEAPESAEAQD